MDCPTLALPRNNSTKGDRSLRRYIPFRIRNRRNRTSFLHISRYLDPIHLFGLLLNREIGLIVHLFDIFDI